MASEATPVDVDHKLKQYMRDHLEECHRGLVERVHNLPTNQVKKWLDDGHDFLRICWYQQRLCPLLKRDDEAYELFLGIEAQEWNFEDIPQYLSRLVDYFRDNNIVFDISKGTIVRFVPWPEKDSDDASVASSSQPVVPDDVTTVQDSKDRAEDTKPIVRSTQVEQPAAKRKREVGDDYAMDEWDKGITPLRARESELRKDVDVKRQLAEKSNRDHDAAVTKLQTWLKAKQDHFTALAILNEGAD